jgi:hypothetical protein
MQNASFGPGKFAQIFKVDFRDAVQFASIDWKVTRAFCNLARAAQLGPTPNSLVSRPR